MDRSSCKENRMTRALVVVLGLLFLTSPLFAADVDGKWAGTLATPNGDVNILFTFKADGATLTGTTTGPDGTERPIKEGKIEGEKVAFKVSVDFGGMPLELAYTGVLKGEQINLTLDVMGLPFDFTVKKTK
jgi:hypothetical protein